MKAMIIIGSPSARGFSVSAAEVARKGLSSRGCEVDVLTLSDCDIRDCAGCMQCMAKGLCGIHDDMGGIIERMKAADCFVVVSSVRNGLMTSCYKRFYERITYLLGFTRELEGKHTLAIANVGLMGGRSINRKYLGLQDIMHTRLSGFLFFKTGIPAVKSARDFADRIDRAVGRLVGDARNRRPLRLLARISAALDLAITNHLMFRRHPEFYAHVIERLEARGHLKPDARAGKPR